MKTIGSKCVFFFLFFVSSFFAVTVVAQQVSLTPATLNFGGVVVGGSKSQTVVVKNITKRKIGIFQASVTGTGYAISGMKYPISIPVGQSVSFSVTFSPPAAATDTGTVSLVTQNWWKNVRTGTSTAQVALSGSGVTGAQISASPSSVAFGSVMVGSSQSATAVVSNTGSANLTISGTSLSSAAFSVSGLNPPITLTAGQSLTFGIVFAPTSGGNASGNLAVTSDASNGQLNMGLSGTGMTPGQLTLSPSTYNFGNVNTGQTATTNGVLKAVGSPITISTASSTSTEFSLSGISLPVSLADGQSIPFTLTFQPQVSGAATGSVSFVSNATNSPSTEALSGTGVTPASHSVDLSWNASGTTGVVGYNVYRGNVSKGPYSKVTSSPESGLSYSDTAVATGTTYYYVITALDSSGMESAYSNEAAVTVPTE